MQRRAVLRSLVAAGGAGALAACLEESSTGPIPTGDPANRPPRQHAWNDRVRQDEHGNFLMPSHHVYLSMEYIGADRAADRVQLEEALTDIERAYEASNEGLLFSLGYSPRYFERFASRSRVSISPSRSRSFPGRTSRPTPPTAFSTSPATGRQRFSAPRRRCSERV
ncbi:MAG: hypothetical protein U5K37_12990 [Natrialbaceae archaeon]|nr:hypothetical protein [Natrialbaceae archaeon]